LAEAAEIVARAWIAPSLEKASAMIGDLRADPAAGFFVLGVGGIRGECIAPR